MTAAAEIPCPLRGLPVTAPELEQSVPTRWTTERLRRWSCAAVACG